ncbi:hypothetical protein L6R52_26370, partial [Myxococcota bacterium]|nr:hypothetical protein [Myxococcota bacterium]
LGRALDAARRCDEEGLGQPRAAALGLSMPRTSAPEPVPDAPSVYARPWFWAVAAVVAIGTAGAFVVGRTAGGPPEAVEIRLVPRP